MSIRFPMGESLSHDLISTLELLPLDGQGLLHQPGWAGCRESPAGSAHSVPSVSARGLSKKGGCVLEVSAAHTTATLVLAHTSLATATHLGSPALPKKDRMDPLTGFLVLSLSQGEGTH